MTQLIWNSKDVVWLQAFKASEDVPTHAARPAVSKFAVMVQRQKSHKLHTWAHVNCRHTPVSLKFKAGVKPIKGHFITFLLLARAFTIKATSALAGAPTSRGPCQPLEEGNATAWVILWHHTVPVVLESAGLKNNAQQGRNGTANITWAGSVTASRGSKAVPDADFPAVLRRLPGLVRWHRSPSDLGWARSRGRQSSVMLLETSASSWHSLGFIWKAAESKRQQPSNNDSEIICCNTCTRAITTVTGYLNW